MGTEDEEVGENPLVVMLDERTGDKYARAVGRKGANQEFDWLVKDMSEELKSWGHAGGSDSKLIMKSNNEPAIVALREKVGKYHGGLIIPEGPPVGESQANGRVEEAGKRSESSRKSTRIRLSSKSEKSCRAMPR